MSSEENKKEIPMPIWAQALQECLEWAEEIAMHTIVEPNSENILRLTEMAVRIRETMHKRGDGMIEA